MNLVSSLLNKATNGLNLVATGLDNINNFIDTQVENRKKSREETESQYDDGTLHTQKENEFYQKKSKETNTSEFYLRLTDATQGTEQGFLEMQKFLDSMQNNNRETRESPPYQNYNDNQDKTTKGDGFEFRNCKNNTDYSNATYEFKPNRDENNNKTNEAVQNSNQEKSVEEQIESLTNNAWEFGYSDGQANNKDKNIKTYYQIGVNSFSELSHLGEKEKSKLINKLINTYNNAFEYGQQDTIDSNNPTEINPNNLENQLQQSPQTPDTYLTEKEAWDETIRIDNKLYHKSQIEEYQLIKDAKFDPKYAKQVASETNSQYDHNAILSTLKNGYMLKDTGEVIQKAEVKVNKKH